MLIDLALTFYVLGTVRLVRLSGPIELLAKDFGMNVLVPGSCRRVAMDLGSGRGAGGGDVGFLVHLGAGDSTS